MEKPRWGFLDIILAYAVITIISLAATLLPFNWTNETRLFLYSFAVQFAATIGTVYVFVVVRYRCSWSDLGIRPVGWKDLARYGITGGFGLIVFVSLFGILIKYFQPNLPPQAVEEVMRAAAGSTQFLLVAASAVILAPIAEEIFYRGMLYPVCKWYLGPFWGAVAAGTIFGLAHWDFWRSIPLAIGGAILCYIYEKTGSILASMVAHGVWNAAMCVLIYLSLRGAIV